MDSIKLIYFGLAGRGEAARMILHYAKVPFKDYRVTKEEWLEMKPTIPSGQLPILEFNGEKLYQSVPINRFLARKYGLAGKDDFESAYLDSIIDFLMDFLGQVMPYIIAYRLELFPELDFIYPKNKKCDLPTLYKEVFKTNFEKAAQKLVELLNDSGSGFLLPSGVSWGDFRLAETISYMYDMHSELVGKYQELVEHVKRVNNLPELKAYVETRPKNAF